MRTWNHMLLAVKVVALETRVTRRALRERPGF